MNNCTHYDYQVQRGDVHVLGVLQHADILDVKLMFRIRSNDCTDSSAKITACLQFLLGGRKGLQNIAEKANWSTGKMNTL
jgi:hypothetical protein